MGFSATFMKACREEHAKLGLLERELVVELGVDVGGGRVCRRGERGEQLGMRRVGKDARQHWEEKALQAQ